MAVELKKYGHPDYVQTLPDYVKIRDCYKGERCVKEGTTKYLPKLSGQSEDDYHNYLTRALFFPITGKTCTTMVGMATAKPPKSKYPDTMATYFEDNSSTYQFTESYVMTFQEVVLMGRYGLLVDALPAPLTGDPKLCHYIAENIVNWSVDGVGKFTMVLLREMVLEQVGQFETQEVYRFRHLYLDGGVYTVQVLDEDLQQVGPPVQPTFSGSVIDYIPFVIIGATGVHAGIDHPPMLDITTINLSHYLTSADLEWGRHIVGLPTPVVTGVDGSTSLKIGGTAAWVLPPAEAKAFYLEFLGEGLASLEKAMTDKIGLMASISARLVDSSSKGSEAAETVRLRYMSESASLIHIIGSIEAGLNLVYNMLATLGKHGGSVVLAFSREILGASITYKDLAVLLDAYMGGTLSKESLLYNLRRLDAADPTRTDAEELAAIKDPPDPSANPGPKSPNSEGT